MIQLFEKQIVVLPVVIALTSCAPVPLPELKPEQKTQHEVRINDSEYRPAKIIPLGNSGDNIATLSDDTPVSVSKGTKVTEPILLKIESVLPRERLQNGIALLKSYKTDQAQREFERVLVDEPDNHVALGLLRQIKLSPKEYFKHIDAFAHYKVKLGDSYSTIATKYLDNALEFHILAKLNKASPTNQLIIGQQITVPVIGHEKKQRTKLKTLNLPDTSGSHSASKLSNDYQRAKKLYAEGKFQSIISLLEEKVTPGHNKKIRELLVLSYSNISDKHIADGQFLEAHSKLKKAIRLQPGNKPISQQLTFLKRRIKADREYKKGLDALESGKLQSALAAFTKVVQNAPNHKKARKQIIKLQFTQIDDLHKTAMTLYKNQQLNEAIEKWDQVLKLNPDHNLAKLYRGRAMELKERFDNLPKIRAK